MTSVSPMQTPTGLETVNEEIDQVSECIFDEEDRLRMTRDEQRKSIVLGMSSLKVGPLEKESKHRKSLTLPTDPVESTLSTQSVSLIGRIISAATSMLRASKNNKCSRKVFRSNNAIELEHDRQKNMNRYIIHPFSPFRWFWDLVMVIALLLTLIALPIEMAFYSSDITSNTWKVINVISDVIFIVDIILNFRTGYVEPATENVILDNKSIVLRYLRTWFFLDLLSSIPFDYLYSTITGVEADSATVTLKVLKVLKLAKLLSLLKIFRMARLLRYVQKLEGLMDIEVQWLRIINLIIVMLLFSHWNGCIQYLFLYIEGFPKETWVTRGGYHLDNSSLTEKYTASMFRALSNMMSIGYGEYKPHTNTEKWLAMLSMTLGGTFYALFIANISALLMTIDASGRQYEEKLSQLKEYMRFRRVPLDIQGKVLGYFEHRYQRKYFEEEIILCDKFMSHTLRQEVLFHNCKDLLRKVNFLAEAPTDFLIDIIEKLKFQCFFPEEAIIQAGRLGDSMYFIEHGSVDIVLPDGRHMNHLTDGAHFGEISLLVGERRVASVIAREICDVYMLSKADFRAVLNDHPKMLKLMENVANERLNEVVASIGGNRNEKEAEYENIGIPKYKFDNVTVGQNVDEVTEGSETRFPTRLPPIIKHESTDSSNKDLTHEHP